MAFAGTVTDEGTVTEVELEESVTTDPPVGAARPRITVQVTGVFGKIEEAHWTDETVFTASVTVPFDIELLIEAVIDALPLLV